MSNIDSVSVLLAGRAGVFRTLQNALGNEPSTEMLEQLCSKETQGVFLLFDLGQSAYLEACEKFFTVAKAHLDGGAAVLSQLESRFTRLFVGPAGLEGNPWEAFHLSKEKTIKQEITLEVRRAYVAEGLIPSAYPRVSDDHIAIELDFLAKLALRIEEAWKEKNLARAFDAASASDAFIREHIIKWVPKLYSTLDNAKHGAGFYQEAVAVLAAFLPLDLEALAELQDTFKE